MSHSARSAWIETAIKDDWRLGSISRTPQGVRGLKLKKLQKQAFTYMSHSARSAWIETHGSDPSYSGYLVALRKECVD